MKWIAGLGQRLGNLLAANDGKASRRGDQSEVIALGLARVLGHPPDQDAVRSVLQKQRQIHETLTHLKSGGATVHYDGLSNLKALQESKRGYLVVYVQSVLTDVLEHVIRTPGGQKAIANVVFKPHDDPSAHVSVLERGHGLAFQLPFFPMDDDHAMLAAFFGEVTAVSLKASAFAVRNGAPVLPIWCRADEQNELCVEIAPPLSGHTSEHSLALALINHFEKRIQASPAEMDWDADCWQPPVRRLLPSRYPWEFYHPAEAPKPKVKPLRLLIRVPDNVRDACLSVPAIRALKRGRIDTQLTVLTPAAMHAFWNRLAECDACLDSDAEGAAEGKRYDLGILLNWEEASLEELTRHGAVRTIGMETHPQANQLDEPLPMPRKLGPPEHKHRTYLRIAHRLGAEVIKDLHLREPMVRPSKKAQAKPEETKKAPPQGRSKKSQSKRKARSKAKPRKPSNRRVIGLAPDSDDGPSYAWPAERFIKVIKGIAASRGYVWRVYLGPETDQEPWDALVADLPEHEIKFVQGATTLEQTLDTLADCQLILANDNDILHLAATVHGIATLAIYGPSDPIQSAPVLPNALTLRRHVECTPCFLSECPLDHRCLTEISVDEVIAALEICLTESGQSRPTQP